MIDGDTGRTRNKIGMSSKVLRGNFLINLMSVWKLEPKGQGMT
jgi:hypothetical protein